MTYDNKIAIIVREDLEDWQKLNVTAFLASSVSIQFPEVHGKSFINGSGTEYLPFIKHPILIYNAEGYDQLKRAFYRAKERALSIGIYTDALFSTKNEEENHREISKYTDDDQPLAGVIIYGENKAVNKALNGLKFHS